MTHWSQVSAVAAILMLSCTTTVGATNVHVINDAQEITGILSGYDINTVTFTLDANDTLTIAIQPYGVPGDADGDGNPDASSDVTIRDNPGVGPLERVSVGFACANPDVCEPDVVFTYTDNVLTVSPDAGPASMTLTSSAYVLTIPQFSQFKQGAGGSTTHFSSFSFSASFTDNQHPDLAPDADAGGFPVCEPIELTPPVVGKTTFDCYAINKVKILDFDGTGLDKITVSKSGFRLPSGATVDLATEMVQIRIDGQIYDFPPGSFEQIGDKPDYRFVSATGETPKITARLRMDKAEWSIKIAKADASLIDTSDGVTIALMIGDYESKLTVPVEANTNASGTFYRYYPKNKTSCRLDDDSSEHLVGENKLSCITSITVQHSSGRLLQKSTIAADLLHPNTVFMDETSGEMAIFHTSCSQALRCGDVMGTFKIVEISALPGDKLSQLVGVADASCSLLPESAF